VSDAPGARPLAILAEELDDAWRAWLGERCDTLSSSIDAAGDALDRAEALIVRTYTRVDGDLLERMPALKVVGRAGVGVDNIDVPACRERGVEVVHTPEANTRAVVELVFAVIFDALRPRLFLDRALGLGEWKRLRAELTSTRELSECTLGILGLGRIGRQVARAASGFDAEVLACDLIEIDASERFGAQMVARDELLERSDILTVHVDDRPGNRGLIGGAELDRLPRGAILINASRGFVVDTEAVARWLGSDPAARAILDVHDPEPFPPGSPLLELPNAHLMPHIGGATARAHQNMSAVVRDVWRVLRGEPAQWPAPEPLG